MNYKADLGKGEVINRKKIDSQMNVIPNIHLFPKLKYILGIF